MPASLNLEGMQDLVKKLDELGRRGNAAQNTALRTGATIIQQAASERAPRSPTEKEHLADNIMVSEVKTKEGVKFIEVGPTRGDNSEFSYGKFLEYGTSKMAAQPFIGPAAAEKEGEVVEAMGAIIKGALGL